MMAGPSPSEMLLDADMATSMTRREVSLSALPCCCSSGAAASSSLPLLLDDVAPSIAAGEASWSDDTLAALASSALDEGSVNNVVFWAAPPSATVASLLALLRAERHHAHACSPSHTAYEQAMNTYRMVLSTTPPMEATTRTVTGWKAIALAVVRGAHCLQERPRCRPRCGDARCVCVVCASRASRSAGGLGRREPLDSVASNVA